MVHLKISALWSNRVSFIIGKEEQQIDLIFDRDDNILTLCEMKTSRLLISTGVIEEIERKRKILQKIYPRHTIQPVLIYEGKISKDLLNSPYIYRKIDATELI